MIDFTKFDTGSLIKRYKILKIFPSINKKGTIKFLKEESINTHQKINKNLGSLLNPATFNETDYIKSSLNYSIQSLIKGLMFYFYSEMNDDSLNGNLSIKFLNLYYSHVFLSYAILQFNGINLDFKKDITVNYKKYYIILKYINLNNNSLESHNTGKHENKKDINHANFWEIYYGIIKDNKDDFFISSIPNGSNYFIKKNFLQQKNESDCRNFYTYNYSSIYDWDNKLRTPEFTEKIKALNHYNTDTSIQITDYNKLKTTIEKELIYIMGLLKKLSYKKDFTEELLSMFKNTKLKSNKKKILDGIDDFIYSINQIM